jgi:exodeoxyribonuclease VII small subunit
MSDTESGEQLAARPFDQLVAELQRIVQALEAGNLPLEESIASYRAALRLHAAAEERLREAELTISQLGRGLDAAGGEAVEGEAAGSDEQP